MRIRWQNKEHQVFLCDDGTLDTVISVDGKEHRFDGEYASQFRKRDGSMTAKGLRALAIEVLEEEIDE